MEYDLRHRHECGATGENLGAPIGVERGKLEVVFQALAQGHGFLL